MTKIQKLLLTSGIAALLIVVFYVVFSKMDERETVTSRQPAVNEPAVSQTSGGGPTRNEMIAYLEKISPIADNIAKGMEAVAPVYTTKGPEAVAKVQRVRANFISLRQQTQDITPPTALQELHIRLVKAIDGYIAGFEQSEEALQTDDSEQLTQAQAKLTASAEELNTVSQEIVKTATK